MRENVREKKRKGRTKPSRHFVDSLNCEARGVRETQKANSSL